MSAFGIAQKVANRLRAAGPKCMIWVNARTGEPVRRLLLVIALLVVAVPLQAQKGKKHDPYKITAEELAEYGDQNMTDVMRRARPNLLMFNGASSSMMGEQTLQGRETGLLIYVGTQQQGDTSVLRLFKASDV